MHVQLSSTAELMLSDIMAAIMDHNNDDLREHIANIIRNYDIKPAPVAERSGVKKNVHPHIFRHTFATLMLNNGADLVAVQELLGHSDPGTTQIYAQITDERRKQEYKQYLVQ